jgi:hypothetical protein
VIVVNPTTRQFAIPGTDLVFGVTADANSAIKHFQCPRYVGNNVDIASSFVRINYRNANGEIDFYLVKDVTVEGDNVTFSWELHPKVTMYKGNVSFVMCVTGPDTKVKWHTTLGRGQVLEGLEPDSALVEGETKDGIAALIAMVDAQTVAVEKTGADQVAVVKAAAKTAQDSAVAEIEAKGASTLATIPGEYTATVNAVQSAANAIRGKVSGEVIRVDDVSPMEHYPVVRVHGKNLLPSMVMDMENWSLVDGTRNNYFFPLNQLDDGKTYTISAEILDGSAGYFYLEESRDGFASNTDRHLHIPGTSRLPFTFTKEVGTDYRLFWHDVNLLISDLATNIQIEEGAVATAYTPYVDPTTIKVTKCRKNLASTDANRWPGVYPLSVVDGVFTSVNAAGAANHRYYEAILPRGKYLLSAKFSGFARFLVKLYGSDGRVLTGDDAPSFGAYNEYYKGFYFSVESVVVDIPAVASYWQFGLIFAAGADMVNTNVTISELQLEVSENVTAYEQFDGEIQIPAADGTVTGLSAISPTMTLLTDTPGVTIECEYSRDTNKVIEEIMNKLAALVGNT